jgi:hypothetical protein
MQENYGRPTNERFCELHQMMHYGIIVFLYSPYKHGFPGRTCQTWSSHPRKSSRRQREDYLTNGGLAYHDDRFSVDYNVITGLCPSAVQVANLIVILYGGTVSYLPCPADLVPTSPGCFEFMMNVFSRVTWMAISWMSARQVCTRKSLFLYSIIFELAVWTGILLPLSSGRCEDLVESCSPVFDPLMTGTLWTPRYSLMARVLEATWRFRVL